MLVEINCETDFVAKNEIFREFVKDITLHIAAASPLYVSRDQVPGTLIEAERRIYAAQVVGKPENIVEKIVDGKIDKFYGTLCLLEQAFIKNPDLTIKDYVNSKIAELGENIVIRRFTRYMVGEELAGEGQAEAPAEAKPPRGCFSKALPDSSGSAFCFRNAKLFQSLVELPASEVDLLAQLMGGHGGCSEAFDGRALEDVVGGHGHIVLLGILCRKPLNDGIRRLVGLGVEYLNAVALGVLGGFHSRPSKTTATCQSLLSWRPVNILINVSRATTPFLACWRVRSGHWKIML